MRFMMCAPDYYEVVYQINPWMAHNKLVNKQLAMQQWQDLYDTLLSCSAQVLLQEPQPGLPDLVFTANAALLYGQDVLLSQFACPERQPERECNRRFFVEHGFNVLDVNTNSTDGSGILPFEGAGDALWAGDVLYLAHGLRTDPAMLEVLKSCFPGVPIQSLALLDPYYYHLDTCFCPLDAKRALLWPAAFSPESQNLLQAQLNCFLVPEAEAQCFACNAVVLDQQVVLPAGCPQTTAWLEDQGFAVHACQLSEFIKAGGAAKCLTLRLDA